MKRIMILALILTACTAMPVQAEQQPQATRPAETAAATPTATLDFMATAEQAQAQAAAAQTTADAAQRLLVDATITHEANILQLAQITQAAEQIAAEQAATTATAYQTAVPLTITAQAYSNAAQSTARAMTITAPTQVVAMARAQTQAETGTYLAWVEIFIKISFGIAMMIMAVSAAVYVFRDGYEADPDQPQPETPEGLLPIPFTHPQGPQGRMLRAEMQCTSAQLVQLAEGIKNGSTLAFGQWKGTPVYPALNAIRQYFIRHNFATELQGKMGELAITEAGQQFIEDTLALGEPPIPHVCMP